MARSINKAILIGNLGSDPELRQTTTGGAMVQINLATTDAWKDKQTGQLQERTEWHRVVFFNRLAEIVSQYAKKGSKLYIEGRVQTRQWQDKDGQARYTTEILANEMQLLDSRPGAQPMREETPPQPADRTMPAWAAPTKSGDQPPSFLGTEPPPFGDFDVPF